MKEMALIFPNCTRVNRGSSKLWGLGALVVKDLVAHCQEKNYSDLVIVHEHRGEPDGIIVSHMPLGPTIYFGIKNCVMRHDLETRPGIIQLILVDPMSEAYPHLIFDGFHSKLGERIAAILKHLFPVPKSESRRVITFSN
jgi:U3 small nucleolar ribonucleoprotein protein IMP4